MNKLQLDKHAQRVARALTFLKLAGFPLLLVALALFFGCNGSLSTYRAASGSTMVTGMAYYLPVGKITIKGEFTSPPSPPKRDTGGATSQDAAPSGKPPAKEETAAGAKTISVGGLTMALSSEVEADMGAGRYAVHVPNAMFEDEIKLTVNPKHLLSAGKATTEDKTAEIVGTVAQLAKSALNVAFAPERTLAPTPTPTPTPPPFYITFYPSSADACDKVHEQLKARKIEFTVEAEESAATTDIPKGKPADPKQGLVFRFAKVYKIHIKYPAYDNDWNVQHPGITLLDTYEKFVLPDTKREFVFEYPRLALVKAVNEIGFTDGMLTDLHQTRPSLIVGILSVPKAVAQAIIPGFPAPTSSGSSSGAGATAKN